MKANIYAELGRKKEALKIYRGLLKDRPAYTAALMGIGHLHLISGDNKKWMDYIIKTLKTNPEDPVIHETLDFIFLEMPTTSARCTELINLLDEILRIIPQRQKYFQKKQLLLSDKLSMTSNKENISLINQFFYYLRAEIKKGKQTEIQALESGYAMTFGSGEAINQDKMIGYHLYNRIFNNGKNTLIDDAIIDKTIKSIVSCNNESDEICYYKFRQRYVDVPTFGYLLGTDFGTNGAENLKKFVLQLPPIFSIQDFTFDKTKSPTLSDATNSKYQGKVTINVYGRSASAQEVDQIAQALGNKCLGENRPLTTQDGINLIKSAIIKLSDVKNIDKSYGDNLRELQSIIQQLDKDFPTLSNYKKTIKLFELYRMLSDAGLCK